MTVLPIGQPHIGCKQSYTAANNIKFSQAQLEGLWINAGGPKQAAPIASAIAMAESGGNSGATCVDWDGTTDRGLWQINSSNGAGSSYDVATNVRAAVAMYNQRGWTPWTTYSSGAYRQFMGNIPPPDLSATINGTAAAATNTVTTSATAQDTSAFGALSPLICNPLTEAVSSAFCVFASPGNFFGSIAQSAIDYAVREVVALVFRPLFNYFGGVIGMLAGGGMIIVGIYMVIQDSRGAQTAIRSTAGIAGVATGNPALAAQAPVGSRQTATQGARRVQTVQAQRVPFYAPQPRQMTAAEALRRESAEYPEPPRQPSRPNRPAQPRRSTQGGPQQPAARRASPYL